MIESKEKTEELTRIIAHWCNHTKITPYLRDADIPSLVSTIIGAFYHITLCCGHKVNELDEIVALEFEDYVVDRSDMEHGGGLGTVHGSYCKDCAKQYKKELGAIEMHNQI